MNILASLKPVEPNLAKTSQSAIGFQSKEKLESAKEVSSSIICLLKQHPPLQAGINNSWLDELNLL